MSAGPRKPTPPAGVETTSRSCPPDHIHVLPGVRTMLCSRAQARRARSPESCKTTPNFGLFETPTPAGPIVVEFLSTVVRRTHSGEKGVWRCHLGARRRSLHLIAAIPRSFQLSRRFHLGAVQRQLMIFSDGIHVASDLGRSHRRPIVQVGVAITPGGRRSAA
jgi:hypothetical protein